MNNGYREKFIAGHHLASKNGMVYEHRLAGERKLGRPLKPGEIVHHEDRHRENNDQSNIIVFRTSGDHARYHTSGLIEYQQDGTATSPGLPKQRCEVCGKTIYSGTRCRAHRIIKTKIEWPTGKKILAMVNDSNVSETARRLGVSDASVKKYLKRAGLWTPRWKQAARHASVRQ